VTEPDRRNITDQRYAHDAEIRYLMATAPTHPCRVARLLSRALRRYVRGRCAERAGRSMAGNRTVRPA
jgi:hypothetical protein